jgi:hypothetical protein
MQRMIHLQQFLPRRSWKRLASQVKGLYLKYKAPGKHQTLQVRSSLPGCRPNALTGKRHNLDWEAQETHRLGISSESSNGCILLAKTALPTTLDGYALPRWNRAKRQDCRWEADFPIHCVCPAPMMRTGALGGNLVCCWDRFPEGPPLLALLPLGAVDLTLNTP